MTQDDIRLVMGYVNNAPKCENCRFFRRDQSTDNFGSGDICAKNEDFKFKVSQDGVCKKFDGV